MKKVSVLFLIVFIFFGAESAWAKSKSKTAADFFCGSGSKIVSKKDEGVFYTYTCSNGKKFSHQYGKLIK